MPYMLKELLYHAILYDYGSSKQQTSDVFNLDDATPEEIQKELGMFK